MIPMSLPRRAMEQMGFSVCCLLCDAPDLPGSERCKTCISSHAKTREKLSLGKANTKSQRLARELIQMISNPSAFIADNIHGQWMKNYSDLINAHQGKPQNKTQDQISAQFERDRNKNKKSLISQVANQNKWSEKPPNPEELIELKKAYGVKNNPRPTTWEDFIDELNRLLEE